MRERRGQGNVLGLGDVDHPDRRLLRQYCHRGGPVVLSGKKWTEGQRRAALERGTHKLTLEHVPFLWEEFDLMVEKGQSVVFTYSVAKEIPGLRLRPPGVKEERDLRPQWLGYYSFSNLN